MRSRHDKRRRSRISPIDRFIQTPAGSAIVGAVRSKTVHRNAPLVPQPDSSDRSPHSSRHTKARAQTALFERSLDRTDGPEPMEQLSDGGPDRSLGQDVKAPRKSLFRRMIHRLQYPVGCWPVVILVLTWMMMLGIIWGSLKEIVSLGAAPTKQTIAQIERKSLLELLGALCLGGVGLSLALTPALKRNPRGSQVDPLQASLDSEE